MLAGIGDAIIGGLLSLAYKNSLHMNVSAPRPPAIEVKVNNDRSIGFRTRSWRVSLCMS